MTYKETDKQTYDSTQETTYINTEKAARTPPKTVVDLGCSRMESRSCDIRNLFSDINFEMDIL